MAKAIINSALQTLRGRIGDLVFKQYDYGTVVTRVPRMNRVKPSRKQLAHRQDVKAAGKFYRRVLNDPTLRAQYGAVAAKERIPLSAVTLRAFFRQLREERARAAKSASG
jgi:hypothetical protein